MRARFASEDVTCSRLVSIVVRQLLPTSLGLSNMANGTIASGSAQRASLDEKCQQDGEGDEVYNEIRLQKDKRLQDQLDFELD